MLTVGLGSDTGFDTLASGSFLMDGAIGDEASKGHAFNPRAGWRDGL
jgi:hypothetical protein